MKTKSLFIAFILCVGLFSDSCTKKCDDHKPQENNDCIDKTKATNQPCYTLRYDPVCGCNKITYATPCDAENAGVRHYVKGECGNSVDK
jgi:hypothetical protein